MKQMHEDGARLTQGSVSKVLFQLAIPMFFGIVGTVAFNLIDTYFVGQLGINELASISFTFPVVFVFGGISFGLGLGGPAGDQYGLDWLPWYRGVKGLCLSPLAVMVKTSIRP